MTYLRITARLVAIFAALPFALALHCLWRLARRASPWPRLYSRYAVRRLGARPAIAGTPLTRDAALLANHLSWLDILLLTGATGTAFVAKAELARVPLVGWICRLNHTVFVARADRLGIAGQVGQLRGALASGRPVTIFPEGTTGDGRNLLPFKPALLAALDGAAARVQPVRIDYGAATDELAWVGEETGPHHVLRVLARRGTFAPTLRFLDPFAPADAGDRKAIAAEARARIEGAPPPPAGPALVGARR